jgi:hypothetical protein
MSVSEILAVKYAKIVKPDVVIRVQTQDLTIM